LQAIDLSTFLLHPEVRFFLPAFVQPVLKFNQRVVGVFHQPFSLGGFVMATRVRTGSCTGWGADMTIARAARTVLLCLGTFCLIAAPLASSSSATDQQTQTPKATQKKKTKKPQQPQLPPLASGPTGPVPQMPLDSIAPVPPQVSYENGQLTIVAPNSTLGDILRAVRKQTGADIDVPDARERVVTHLGPGPARDVIADLLNGSRFNYVMLGSPQDGNALTRIVLVAKTGPDNPPPQPSGQPSARHPNEIAQQQQDAAQADEPEDNAADDNTNNDQPPPPAEAEQQPAASPDQQQGPKTPQQLLQEMQQRQLQLQQQQQQQPGQPPQPPPQQQQQ
jgi:hypothetical protein